jgi:hypothetical protein
MCDDCGRFLLDGRNRPSTRLSPNQSAIVNRLTQFGVVMKSCPRGPNVVFERGCGPPGGDCTNVSLTILICSSTGQQLDGR